MFEGTNEEEGKVVAYVDKLTVGQGGMCGSNAQSSCNPGLQVWGHASDGGDVAFLIVLRDRDGNVLGHTMNTNVHDNAYRFGGGLLSMEADGRLTTSAKNPGPPWKCCTFAIHTQGSGGYTLTQFLGYYTRVGSLHQRSEAIYRVQAVASPVVWETTPDGALLTRRCTEEWNWDAMIEVPLHIYYNNRRYNVVEASKGEVPEYLSPTILSVGETIFIGQEPKGYADVTVTFETDIEAQGRVYWWVMSTPDDEYPTPLSKWQSALTELGTRHVVKLDPNTLWYNVEEPKLYQYQVVAFLPRYPHCKEARAYSDMYQFPLRR